LSAAATIRSMKSPVLWRVPIILSPVM